MKKEKYLIVVATYNEMENLPLLVEALFQETDRWENDAFSWDILVVDDHSPDGTGEWCDAQKDSFPRLKCLHRYDEKGLGSAVVAGMRYAVEHAYDRMVNMDADFSHSPADLASLCGRTSEGTFRPVADVVIGSRYISGGKIIGWPWFRHLMSRLMNTFGRILLGLKVHDISGSYRNYSVEALRKLDFSRIQSQGYSFFEEILWRLRQQGVTMEEVPIRFEDRLRGTSKINWKESFRAVQTLLCLRK
ncbi:MAG: polyprenol monophosphomannose synthase [Planctomycetia bacterium]|nr:polyprenol monophosphomannose synthase [Planctomycetia bacterium]